MSATAIAAIGALICGVITILLNIRNNRSYKAIEKKLVRQQIREYYYENIQRYSHEELWMDVILDFCRDTKVTDKGRKRIFSCFKKDFEFESVNTEIEI